MGRDGDGAAGERVGPPVGSCRIKPTARPEVLTLTLRLPTKFRRRGGRKLIIAPDGRSPPLGRPDRDENMIKAHVKAHCWQPIESGQTKSITDLAGQEGVTDAYVCRLLPLTCLATEIPEAILDGRRMKGLRLAALLRGIPGAWQEQRRLWSWRSKSAESSGLRLIADLIEGRPGRQPGVATS